MRTLDSKETGRVFGLVAGEPGIGKTTQGTTFPKKETLILSVEDGILSISGSGYAVGEIDSYDDLLKTVQSPPKWVKYLYIDSLSEIYDVIKKELSDKFTRSQNYAKHEEMELKIIHLIREARKLSIDVFFTCHVKQVADGLGISHDLAFDGKMPANLKKQFDLIVHMTTETEEDGKTKRIFITSPEKSMLAKARVSPWLNIKINDKEEANLYGLTKKLKGE